MNQFCSKSTSNANYRFLTKSNVIIENFTFNRLFDAGTDDWLEEPNDSKLANPEFVLLCVGAEKEIDEIIK